MERILHEFPSGEAITRVALPSLRSMIEAVSGMPPEGKDFSPDDEIRSTDRAHPKYTEIKRKRK